MQRNYNDKKRKAAETFYKKSVKFGRAHKKARSYEAAKEAIKEQSGIPSKYQKYDDKRAMAKYQNQAGFYGVSTEKQLKWHSSAVVTLGKIPKHRRQYKDWRKLSAYSNNAGVVCNADPGETKWFERAIKQIRKIPAPKRTYSDYLSMQLYNWNLGYIKQNPLEKLALLQKTIKYSSKVPLLNRTKNGWRRLVAAQLKIGKIYKKQGNWPKAWSYFQAALDAKKLTHHKIKLIYKKLKSMAVEPVEKKLYGLAYDLWNDNTLLIGDIKYDLRQIYLAVWRQPGHNQSYLLQLLKLLRLIDKYGTKANFSNPVVVAWLSDPQDVAEFKSMLREVEKAYQPPALGHLLEQGYGITRSLVMKMAALERRVNELEEQNTNLLAQQQSQSLEKQPSHFSTTLTVFGTPAIPREEKGKEKEQVKNTFMRP